MTLHQSLLNSVRVWYLHFDSGRDDVALLDANERQRLDCISHARTNRQFRIGRAWMRMVLASLLDSSPSDIRFEYGPHGKPKLAADESLQFNLSHSGDWAALAVTRRAAVGIDIEQVRPDRATLDLAQRFFSEAEKAALLALPELDRADAFFRCWTRKEAFIKLLGDGLTHPLDAFDVSIHAEDAAMLKAVRSHGGDPSQWSLHHLTAPSGYFAAAAVAGQVDQVVESIWTE